MKGNYFKQIPYSQKYFFFCTKSKKVCSSLCNDYKILHKNSHFSNCIPNWIIKQISNKIFHTANRPARKLHIKLKIGKIVISGKLQKCYAASKSFVKVTKCLHWICLKHYWTYFKKLNHSLINTCTSNNRHVVHERLITSQSSKMQTDQFLEFFNVITNAFFINIKVYTLQ